MSRSEWNEWFKEADRKEVERLENNISRELAKPEGQRNERILARWQYKLSFYRA